jgi:hypothetical protein
MWLKGFHSQFQEAAKLVTGREMRLGLIEQKLAEARSRMQIGPEELRIIEDESESAWTYKEWWDQYSGQVEQPIQLPPEVQSREGKQKAIEILYEKIKHIEIVSIVLRFLRPQEFGIISPPVEHLLNLSPAENHIEHYMGYLDILNGFVGREPDLDRVADVDMALWAAAHLSTQRDYAALTEDMNTDPYFQEVRLRNLTEGLGRHWVRDDGNRLLLARVLLKRDYLIAAGIGARVFESLVFTIAENLKVDADPRRGQSKAGALVEKLERDKQQQLRKLGLEPDNLTVLWERRNDAVHPDRQITAAQAVDFVQKVNKLWGSAKANR